MKVVFFTIFIAGIIVGCSKHGGSGQTSNPFPEYKVQGLDGSVWLVTAKFCDGQTKSTAGSERLQFENGLFTMIFQTRDDSENICTEARVFSRTLQGFSSEDGYNETSSLTPQKKRIVCRSKLNGSTLSDDTLAFSGSVAMLSVAISGDAGTAELKESGECPEGILRFFLKRR